jgi:hypothetical protein
MSEEVKSPFTKEEMVLVDHFAGLAMQTYLQVFESEDMRKVREAEDAGEDLDRNMNPDPLMFADEIASWSYGFADAMMAERKERWKP